MGPVLSCFECSVRIRFVRPSGAAVMPATSRVTLNAGFVSGPKYCNCPIVMELADAEAASRASTLTSKQHHTSAARTKICGGKTAFIEPQGINRQPQKRQHRSAYPAVI